MQVIGDPIDKKSLFFDVEILIDVLNEFSKYCAEVIEQLRLLKEMERSNMLIEKSGSFNEDLKDKIFVKCLSAYLDCKLPCPQHWKKVHENIERFLANHLKSATKMIEELSP